MRYCLILATLLTTYVCKTALSQSYQQGDKVMVVARVAKLTGSESEVDAKTYVAESLTVTKTSDNQLFVGLGWINKKDVVPFDQAIAYFTQQIEHEADGFHYYSRARAYYEMDEFDKAIDDYTEALKLDAGQPARLAMEYVERGRAWYDKREFDQAIADYCEAIYNNRYYANAYQGRGFAFFAKQEYDRAMSDYNEAIRLDPNFDVAYEDRAHAWLHKGKYQEAISDLECALRLDSNDSYAYNARAWICAASCDPKLRDGAKAVELATKACELNGWKNADFVATLAAGYAEKGDFDSAIKWETKALGLKLGENSENTSDVLQARLELYKSGKPCHDDTKRN